MKNNAVEIQNNYYTSTANTYDRNHVNSLMDRGHNFNLYFLSSMIDLFQIKSILDVGSGTGRTIEFIRNKHPEVKVVGIEPVQGLRQQAYEKGIPMDVIIAGDGNKIEFEDGAFDLVCEFGMLHHVSNPERVVSEMIRVSSKAIFISDSNNFGQGGFIGRSTKQVINFFGLWKLFNYVKTKGKGYQISEGDGLFYSYSVFNNVNMIKEKCKSIYYLSSKNSGTNLYRSSSDIGLFALKK
ncbi:MAG: class I SAM-dependent methyltransferase [Flavobacteriales bacterium]|nr:class I SAM-dependent methyltransferase [Flavobacteriales bacterium]